MTTTATLPKGLICAETEGAELKAFGDTLTVKLTAEQTGGTMSVLTTVTQPGGGPPPHVHSQDDELFIVMEGRVAFLNEGAWRETGPGDIVYMPRGVPHAFKNVGETPSKMVIVTRPSGFETFMTRCCAVFGASEQPNMDEIVAISAEHGITYL